MDHSTAGAKTRAGSFDLWLLGLILAGAFGVYLAGTAGIIGRYNDDSFYALAAKSLAESGLSGLETMRADPSRFPVGFPAFLAAIWILAGRDFSVVPVWEVSVALLSAAFFLVSYALLTRAWSVNRWVAGSAVVLLAFHPVTAKYAGAVMSDLPCATLMAVALALLVAARRRQRSMKSPGLAGSGSAGSPRLAGSGSPGSPGLAGSAGWEVAAGVALGLCFITRYAALALVIAAVAAFVWERRFKAAALIGLAAAGTAAPWLWWVVGHRAYGYAEEYALSAGTRSYGGSLLDSASWLFFESLPGLLLPQPFLLGIETSDPVPAPFGPLAIAGLVLAGLLLVGCAVNLLAAAGPSEPGRSEPGRSEPGRSEPGRSEPGRSEPGRSEPGQSEPGPPASSRPHEDPAARRLPALFAVGTVLLVLVWSGRFPKLGWDLQIRLLLPVAPIVLAFAIERAAREVARLPERRRAVFAVLAVLLVSFTGLTDLRIASAQVNRTRAESRDFLRGLLAARSYFGNVPADVRVGTLYSAQASFYIPRRFEAVRPSIAGLREARDKGIRLVLATPYHVGDKDVMRESVNALTDTRPPEARVLFAPTDNVAIVHLPAKRPGGP